MITRAKSGIFKPKTYTTRITSDEPVTYSQAASHKCWKAAMDKEYSALIKNKTWELVHKPDKKNLIGCKWTFKLKKNPDGTINRYKARLVAKGYTQENGFDYTETFSPIVKPATIRLIFTIALENQWSIKHLDVNNAFLNGTLQEEVYMQQPEGYINNTNLMCKLNKAIYGLKQSPRVWFDKLKSRLVKIGYHPTKTDNSLFTKISEFQLYVS